jgi:benzil reductase ((S)-benzoin forming)
MIMKSEEVKFAFITGTSSGIGLAAANELLKRGWEVIGVARRNSAIHNNNYTHLSIDLTDIDKILNEIPAIVGNKLGSKRYNRMALINNAAGTGELLKLEQLDPQKLSELYKLNVVLPVWLTGLFYKNKTKDSKLRIIDISSGAARKEFPGMAAYCGSKAALLMSGKVFAMENLEDENLAVMSYEPGTVDTEMQKKARSQPEDKFPSVNVFQSMKENNSLAAPEDVAIEIADFLEKNDSGYSQKRFGVKT